MLATAKLSLNPKLSLNLNPNQNKERPARRSP
jgi:hypothetical protein